MFSYWSKIISIFSLDTSPLVYSVMPPAVFVPWRPFAFGVTSTEVSTSVKSVFALFIRTSLVSYGKLHHRLLELGSPPQTSSRYVPPWSVWAHLFFCTIQLTCPLENYSEALVDEGCHQNDGLLQVFGDAEMDA